MRSVLMSIRPKWCELIANGKKTIEIRKTRSKLETPFKVYIYCTNIKPIPTDEYIRIQRKTGGRIDDWNGKVIGEFVCDKIYPIRYSCGSYRCEGLTRLENDRIASASQLSLYDMRNYLSCNDGYAWHISDLVIYDTPKSLSEFSGLRKTKFGYEPVSLTRPPQSWCYVEEVNQP